MNLNHGVSWALEKYFLKGKSAKYLNYLGIFYLWYEKKISFNSQSVGGSGVLATPANGGCEDGFALREQLLSLQLGRVRLFGAASLGQWMSEDMHHSGSQSHNSAARPASVQQQQLSCGNYFYEFWRFHKKISVCLEIFAAVRKLTIKYFRDDFWKYNCEPFHCTFDVGWKVLIFQLDQTWLTASCLGAFASISGKKRAIECFWIKKNLDK